ncbi:hypothetical protein RTM1035_07068 [Roseovarius sp. TM1035]|nr:hypothetical protein RTM1035_07068 [Roseovarius sp. TM1035]
MQSQENEMAEPMQTENWINGNINY